MAYINCALDIFTFLMLCIVFVGSTRIYRMEPGQGPHFLIFILLTGLGVLMQSIFWWETARGRGGSLLSVVADEIYYACFYAILVCFIYFVAWYISLKKPVSPWYGRIGIVIGSICVLIWTIPGLRSYMYQADAQGGMLRGSIYLAGSIGGYILGGLALIIILKNFRLLDRHERTALLSFMAFPAIANVVSIFANGISCAPFFISLSVLMIQNFLQYNNMLAIREQRQRIQEDKIRILLSQTRPHFIFNSLNAIYYLCDQDKDQAKEAIGVFSSYLRKNLNSINQEETVPVHEELEHVKLYLRLEKMRFYEKLQVEFDIHTEDFRIPPLTIEPMVENAVKHGLSKKESGGTVTIHTNEEPESWLVRVTDDGVGFDPEYYLSGNAGNIGITNVRGRIEAICGGSMDIDSTPGEGTTVTIRLPKE